MRIIIRGAAAEGKTTLMSAIAACLRQFGFKPILIFSDKASEDEYRKKEHPDLGWQRAKCRMSMLEGGTKIEISEEYATRPLRPQVDFLLVRPDITADLLLCERLDASELALSFGSDIGPWLADCRNNAKFGATYDKGCTLVVCVPPLGS